MMDEQTSPVDLNDDATGQAAGPSPNQRDELKWYVLKVQSNREKSIRETLMRRILREALERHFGEPLAEAIVIPTEKIKETKGGKTRVVEQKLYPGYIMILMELNDETWYLVRDTSGVGDFTGAAGKPIPMQQEEIDRMLRRETEEETQVKVHIDLAEGDVVKIKDG
ncbi:MAG: transcription termination/antitermination NusG family protein, partial [Planctomycetaceae bacterium]